MFVALGLACLFWGVFFPKTNENFICSLHACILLFLPATGIVF